MAMQGFLALHYPHQQASKKLLQTLTRCNHEAAKAEADRAECFPDLWFHLPFGFA